MKNVVECYKELFGNFDALETNGVWSLHCTWKVAWHQFKNVSVNNNCVQKISLNTWKFLYGKKASKVHFVLELLVLLRIVHIEKSHPVHDPLRNPNLKLCQKARCKVKNQTDLWVRFYPIVDYTILGQLWLKLDIYFRIGNYFLKNWKKNNYL